MMMKCVYFLLFVAASQAFVTRDVQRSIPIPQFRDINLFDNPVLGFSIAWRPVTSTDSIIVTGYRVIVMEEVRPFSGQFRSFQDIGLYGEDKTIAAVAELATGLSYDIRIQAITNIGYGPLSTRWGVMAHPRSNGEGKSTYTLVGLEEADKRE